MAFNIAAAIPSMIGMATTIGSAIPGLKKPKRTKSSQAAAQRAQADVQKAAIGAANTGRGSNRGLQIRSGLRAASQAALDSGGGMAQAADLDEQRFQGQMDTRNENLKNFGADVGAGAAAMTQAALSPETKSLKTGAVGMTKDANSKSAFTQAEQTLPTEDRPQGSGISGEDDGESEAIQQEVKTLMKNAQLAQDDDPRFSGPNANFATQDRLDQLRAKSPTVASPQIEAGLEFRLRAQKMMRQDAERMGMNLETIYPMISRQMQLKPGQGLSNPLGISFQTDFDSSVDAPEGQ